MTVKPLFSLRYKTNQIETVLIAPRHFSGLAAPSQPNKKRRSASRLNGVGVAI